MPAGEAAAARRTHFFTSRAMELLVVTGLLNILLRGIAYSASFSRAFFAMLSVKMVLLVCMAGVQIWMGLAWRRADPSTVPGHLRAGLILQILLGALAILLGLGLRSV